MFDIKLTEFCKVKFCTNYEKSVHIVPKFREISLSHTPQTKHTRTRAHTHTHTNISNTVSVYEGIYLVLHIQFSCCPMKLLSVASGNFHTNNYRCIVTATLHAVPFRVWHLLMFYGMLHFVQPTFLYTLAVPQPLFTRSQSSQSRTVERPTATAQHCCTSAPVHPIPVHTITNGTTAHSTALLYLSPCSPDPNPHNDERYNGPQHNTAVPQPLFTRSQSTQLRMVQRPTATARHCCTSAPVHQIPVHKITNGTTTHNHSTALLYLSPCSPDSSPHIYEWYDDPQHSTAVPQPLFNLSQSTQSRTVQRPTATAQHCCTSAPVYPITVHTITNGTTAHSHSTALLYRYVQQRYLSTDSFLLTSL